MHSPLPIVQPKNPNVVFGFPDSQFAPIIVIVFFYEWQVIFDLW